MTLGLGESLSWWLDAVALKTSSARTLETYGRIGRAFAQFAAQQGATALAEVTPALLRQYLAAMRARGCRPHTVRQHYRTLKAWLRWCVREELLPYDPTRRVEPPSAPVSVRWTPSVAELKQLAAAAKPRPRDYAMLLVLLDTGMRISECMQLTVGDAGRDRVVVRGKGGRVRVVFFSPRTRWALRRYRATLGALDDAEPLWRCQRTGAPLSMAGALESLQRLGERVLGRHLGAHALRRAFATCAIRNGCDLETLRRLLGHTSLAVLQHYAALTDADLQHAHRQATPLRDL